ncbi:hypothetical protein J6590_000412 [Homalodisca vitripennis]|nr:hypothetical protein J6590_000412 [Homalodisca vitripennis]
MRRRNTDPVYTGFPFSHPSSPSGSRCHIRRHSDDSLESHERHRSLVMHFSFRVEVHVILLLFVYTELNPDVYRAVPLVLFDRWCLSLCLSDLCLPDAQNKRYQRLYSNEMEIVDPIFCDSSFSSPTALP